MCFSALHQLAGQLAHAAAHPVGNGSAAAEDASAAASQDPAAAITAMLASMGIVLPPGFRPPPPPPGWKPGDAIEFPPELLAQLAGLAAQAGVGGPPGGGPATVAEEAMGMDFGLLLGEEEVQLELASEGSSDEDDSDAESL